MTPEQQSDPKVEREYRIEEIEIDPGKVSDDVLKRALETEKLYALLGLALSVLLIVAGIVFAILGFSDSIDITVEGGGAKGHVVTGSLGLALILVGAAILYFTRYRVKLTSPATK